MQLTWLDWAVVALYFLSMAASLLTGLLLQSVFGLNSADPRQLAYIMLITVGVSTVAWLSATFLTAPEPDGALRAFYRRVRPGGAWGSIAALEPASIPASGGWDDLVCWLSGCVMIYCSLFGAGKVIFKQYALGFSLLALALTGAAVIYRNLNRRGWNAVVD